PARRPDRRRGRPDQRHQGPPPGAARDERRHDREAAVRGRSSSDSIDCLLKLLVCFCWILLPNDIFSIASISRIHPMQSCQKNLQEQRALLEEAKIKLSDNFKSIAATALQQNNQGFLALANEKFNSLATQSATDLEQRQKSIETLVKPVSDSLLAYRTETQQ